MTPPPALLPLAPSHLRLLAAVLVVVAALLSARAVHKVAALRSPIPTELGATTEGGGGPTVLDGDDSERASHPVALEPRLGGFRYPIQATFVPGHADLLVVIEKEGAAFWVDLDGERRRLASIDVLTQSEQGLLGLAFAPDFARSGRLYLSYSATRAGKPHSVVEQWRVPLEGIGVATATPHHVVLEVEQPYGNHDGGQILFGPDGMLYVMLGDGGAGNDPHGHGQNRGTLLGSILRLDVATEPYAVPPDNPWAEGPGRPEIWAYGVRNPWRVTFDDRGRLIVADVGQNRWEEVGFAAAGDNLGWNTREGRRCFPPERRACDGAFRDPFWVYGRKDGVSVTGGDLHPGTGAPGLKGRYVLGDYGSGRLWALTPPDSLDAPPVRATALGRFDIRPVSFTRTPGGELWVVELGGRILALVEPSSP